MRIHLFSMCRRQVREQKARFPSDTLEWTLCGQPAGRVSPACRHTIPHYPSTLCWPLRASLGGRARVRACVRARVRARELGERAACAALVSGHYLHRPVSPNFSPPPPTPLIPPPHSTAPPCPHQFLLSPPQSVPGGAFYVPVFENQLGHNTVVKE